MHLSIKQCTLQKSAQLGKSLFILSQSFSGNSKMHQKIGSIFIPLYTMALFVHILHIIRIHLDKILTSYYSAHCYFSRLNLKKMGLSSFIFQSFQILIRTQCKKELFNSCEGLLMAVINTVKQAQQFQPILKNCQNGTF